MDVIDRHYSANVSCMFSSVDAQSASLSGFFSTRTSTGTDSGTGGVQGIQSLGFGSVQTYPWHQMFILCHIPPRYQGRASDILGYRVDER